MLYHFLGAITLISQLSFIQAATISDSCRNYCSQECSDQAWEVSAILTDYRLNCGDDPGLDDFICRGSSVSSRYHIVNTYNDDTVAGPYKNLEDCSEALHTVHYGLVCSPNSINSKSQLQDLKKNEDVASSYPDQKTCLKAIRGARGKFICVYSQVNTRYRVFDINRRQTLSGTYSDLDSCLLAL